MVDPDPSWDVHWTRTLTHGTKFPTWAEAARIVFSFTPNSAGAERVFSLLKLTFGDLRDSALADMMQATLMLMYNKRVIGHAE